jgi:hypothetical protein
VIEEVVDAPAAAPAVLGKRSRAAEWPLDASAGMLAQWRAKQPALSPQSQLRQRLHMRQQHCEAPQLPSGPERQAAAAADEQLQVQLSSGSGSSTCSTFAGDAEGIDWQLLAVARHQLQQQQQQQQQQQLNMRRRLSALRAPGAAPPQPARALLAPLDAALAWAGGVLVVEAREVFLLARHMWARVEGRADELLLASLGASQPHDRVMVLAALWIASKLEGGRRSVAGASRLCAATGLSKWGVTSVEVHLLQVLDFSPYRGW